MTNSFTTQPLAERNAQPTNQPTSQLPNQQSYTPPKLTKHGRVAALTHDYPPFFQEMIVAETSP
jgi:hypothetical protein